MVQQEIIKSFNGNCSECVEWSTKTYNNSWDDSVIHLCFSLDHPKHSYRPLVHYLVNSLTAMERNTNFSQPKILLSA